MSNSSASLAAIFVAMWQPIATAGFGQDIQLAVIDRDEVHALVFPCQRVADGWINAESKERIRINPTHWRAWENGQKLL